MVIVIECEACHSRFRLAKALFKESKAIRVRCRKCGGYIVVENPNLFDAVLETSGPAPRIAPEPEPERAPEPVREPARQPGPPPALEVEEPQEKVRPPAEEPMRAMADLLREIETETERASTGPSDRPPALPPELTAPAPDAEGGSKRGPVGRTTPYPEPPDGSEALASVLEDLFKHHPPSPPAEAGRSSSPKAGSRWPEPGKAPSAKEDHRTRSERPPYARPLFIGIAVVWLLLLGGAALLFGTGAFEGRFWSKRTWKPAVDPYDKSAPQASYDITGVKYFTDNAFDGGTLFAVTGNIMNLGTPAKGGIRVRAMLMGRDNTVLSERVVYAGNWIDNTMLRHTKRDVVDAFLSRQAEAGSLNRDVPKGETVPFLAVFFDPPDKIESVVVKAVPAESR
ncbi:MAG: family finger-like protein [Deltaproteobacteria bacterium]|nr:family finger-like protein [Deltaproteobacteria bacterium]